MANLKPILAALSASALTYICILTWGGLAHLSRFYRTPSVRSSQTSFS